MFTESDLRDLLSFVSPSPVLSVYLNTDGGPGQAEIHRIELRSLLKNIILNDEVTEMERYFAHEYEWTGKSVAVFSSSPQSFFRAYPLAIPLRNQAIIADRPAIQPLARMMEDFGGYGVALVDKQGARLFHFNLGELSEQDGTLGEPIKHVKKGGGSSRQGSRGSVAGSTRYEDETVERNMKEAVRFATHFFEAAHIRRIILGGTDENITLFRKELPKAIQSLIMGTFPMSMGASPNEIGQRAMELIHKARQKSSERLVESLFDSAGRNSGGVLGLKATLEALNDQRIRTLLVQDGLQEPGWFCSECERITLDPEKECEGCGKPTQPLEDAIEMVINQVFKHGGDVEILSENEKLRQSGGIGALLRY